MDVKAHVSLSRIGRFLYNWFIAWSQGKSIDIHDLVFAGQNVADDAEDLDVLACRSVDLEEYEKYSAEEMRVVSIDNAKDLKMAQFGGNSTSDQFFAHKFSPQLHLTGVVDETKAESSAIIYFGRPRRCGDFEIPRQSSAPKTTFPKLKTAFRPNSSSCYFSIGPYPTNIANCS